MVGMRQLIASIGVAEQGYVEAMHASTGAVLRVSMHAAGGHGHTCNDGNGHCVGLVHAPRQLVPLDSNERS